jgi:dephospho-CoA kinase
VKVIGLAGGSGSGKSTVCKLFSEKGFAFINTDEVYHKLTSTPTPCLDDLVHEFGREILNDDFYSLNRKKLAEIVFAEGAEKKLKILNEISHFHILNETEEIITSLSDEEYFGVLIDAPLLFESAFDKKCDFVISVIADENIRIKRITERDGISEENAKIRINKQLSNDFLKKKSKFIIVNDGDINELKKAVDEISEKIKKL